jgi:hypothetical protein
MAAHEFSGFAGFFGFSGFWFSGSQVRGSGFGVPGSPGSPGTGSLETIHLEP